MSVRERILRLAARPHLPRRTVRLRLTFLYGGLFALSGAVLLTVTYGLVRRATDGVYVYRGQNGVAGAIVESPDKSSSKPTDATTSHINADGGAEQPAPEQAAADARRLEALARQQHDDQLHNLLEQLALALGLSTIISVALGWFIAGRVLRPIRTITRTARDISATNLHQRLALAGPDDELTELGATIDDLLARLERAFDAQRLFVANASHELRTPLARQRAIAQLALTDPDATLESLQTAHARVVAAGEEQERLIEALLTLTRGHAGLVRHEPFDLATITRAVLRDRAASVEARHLQIEAALDAAWTTGDGWLAERLVANLIDNAIHHNRTGGVVQLATATNDDGDAILSVVNDGPVVPEEQIPRLLEPLQRLDPARTSSPEGHGLGLSIVKAVADAHHATVAIHARAHGGLDVKVHFSTIDNLGRPRAGQRLARAGGSKEDLPHT